MKSTFRFLMSSFLVGFMAMGNISILKASNGDILTYTGSGSLNSVEVFRINSTGNVVTTNGFTQTNTAGVTSASISQGDMTLNTSSSTLQFGDGTVVPATMTATRSQGTFFTGYLQNGSAAVNINATEGMVLCATTSAVGQGITLVACPNSLNLPSWAGIAVAAASTGSVVNVFDTGWVNALTTGTVNAGDQLVTSSLTQGYLQSWTLAQVSGSTSTVAIALTAGIAAGGLTKVKLR